uniref:Uncharacterized protein n=1 Tax=Cucumis melo TaxID=3656 RepID=A0A9I9CCP4_CUCME
NSVLSYQKEFPPEKEKRAVPSFRLPTLDLPSPSSGLEPAAMDQLLILGPNETSIEVVD